MNKQFLHSCCRWMSGNQTELQFYFHSSIYAQVVSFGEMAIDNDHNALKKDTDLVLHALLSSSCIYLKRQKISFNINYWRPPRQFHISLSFSFSNEVLVSEYMSIADVLLKVGLRNKGNFSIASAGECQIIWKISVFTALPVLFCSTFAVCLRCCLEEFWKWVHGNFRVNIDKE